MHKFVSYIWNRRFWVKALLLALFASRTIYKNDYISAQWIAKQQEFVGTVNRHILDQKYYTVDKKTFEAMVKAGWSLRPKYLVDRFDCDDFTVAFKGRMAELFGINSIGIMIDWGASHAYNIVILADGSVNAFEPQAGLWAILGGEFYPCKDGVLIL